MKKIAFFDFDGTITTKDTMLEIIRFHFGDLKYLLGMFRVSPWLVGLKAGLISNQKAKEKLLAHFFKGMNAEKFETICKSFSDSRLREIIDPKATQKINALKKSGFEVVVVTASPSDWIKYWCREMNLPYISSDLEILDKNITGKLKGLNCNYSEKVNRIRSIYKLEEYQEIYAFGDSKGDREMLSIATKPHFKKFD